MSAAPFLHSSLLQVINDVMLWPAHVQTVPQASSFLHSSFLQVIDAVMLWPVHVQKVAE